jgi:phosphoenolpyruvate phosphomutase
VPKLSEADILYEDISIHQRLGGVNIKKTAQLKQSILSKRLEFLMEAHNALSAVIVEEAGFKGIWASGLSMSASMGVRDNNEASWTQVIDNLEFMSDATSIPILLDGDTGYGNFNNARRLVKKLEQRGIAGVCIEDKQFPKTNSFIAGEAQPLASIEEFSGKIKAMKDEQRDEDFVVVARVEALIAGRGMEEALQRAEAYRLAGADAVLIHSKKSDVSEIEAFMKEWGGRLPVVIIPTKYYSTPTSRFRELGVNAVIWANHNLRASVAAMQELSQRIFREQSLISVEDNVAALEEIFRLQKTEELQLAEERYLPKGG